MGIAAAVLAALLFTGPTTPTPPALMHGSSGSAFFRNGRVDVELTLDRLQQAHITTYFYEIYRGHARNQWDELPAFLDGAAERGISVFAYLFPPSESNPPYQPFGFDYPRWAAELAELSLVHPALKGFTIDDFAENPGAFPPKYAARIANAARARNPGFQFWPMFYYRDLVGKHAVIDHYGRGVIDGVVFPFRDEPVYDTSVSTTAATQILRVRRVLKPNQHLAVMVYATHYTRQKNKGNPTPRYVSAVTNEALALGAAGFDDGAIIYNLNLTGHDSKNALAADYDCVAAIYGSTPVSSQTAHAKRRGRHDPDACAVPGCAKNAAAAAFVSSSQRR